MRFRVSSKTVLPSAVVRTVILLTVVNARKSAIRPNASRPGLVQELYMVSVRVVLLRGMERAVLTANALVMPVGLPGHQNMVPETMQRVTRLYWD